MITFMLISYPISPEKLFQLYNLNIKIKPLLNI